MGWLDTNTKRLMADLNSRCRNYVIRPKHSADSSDFSAVNRSLTSYLLLFQRIQHTTLLVTKLVTQSSF